MSTVLRPEISLQNPYWIEKHRYYELKHFCLQYPIWKRLLRSLDAYSGESASIIEVTPVNNHYEDPTARRAMARTYYSSRIDMIERVAKSTDPTLSDYILKGITNGVSYEFLKARLEIPCGKDLYYDRYRRFFWLLDQERQ